MKYLILLCSLLISLSCNALRVPEGESALFESYKVEAKRLLDEKFGEGFSSRLIFTELKVFQKVSGAGNEITVRKIIYADPTSEVSSVKREDEFESPMAFELAKLKSRSAGDPKIFEYQAYQVVLYMPKEFSSNVQETKIERAVSIKP